MPRICEFYGILIYMYFAEHGVPHFHALYGEQQAAIAIPSLRIVEGQLPNRALSLVRSWARIHLDELEENWTLARQGLPPRSIAPLE